MRALLFFFCLTVPSLVHGADFTFSGFDARLDLPQGWEGHFNRTLSHYPNVVRVDFTYFERRVSGPQSHMVIVSVKMNDGSYRGGAFENFFSSKFELARGALVNALKLLPRKID